MDRTTVYAGALPREVDILTLGKSAMVGLGYLAEATMGEVVADGFNLTATAPASLTLNVGRGSIMEYESVDATAWSSLAADPSIILKQGIQPTATTLVFTPPGTVGFSQNFLIQAQYTDTDAGNLVLPYYNAADPTQPLSGPGNNGQSQPTTRKGNVAIQVKAGLAATAGTQITPTPDAGWSPLYVVTLNAGQSQITSTSWSIHPDAPFVTTKLPAVPRAVQAGQWIFGVATGTNNLVASLSPTPLAIPQGLRVYLLCPNTNTGAMTLNLSGFGASSIVRRDGLALKEGDVFANMVLGLVRTNNAWMTIAPCLSEIIDKIGTIPGSAALFNPRLMVLKAIRPVNATQVQLTSTYQSWALNTVVQNQIAGASLEAGSPYRITLPAGSYRVQGYGVARNAELHQCRFYNETLDTPIASGVSVDSRGEQPNPNASISLVHTRFTLAATSNIKFEHVDHAADNYGGGAGSQFGDGTLNQVRTDAVVYIERETGTP